MLLIVLRSAFECRGIPPLRQEKVAKTGLGAFVPGTRSGEWVPGRGHRWLLRCPRSSDGVRLPWSVVASRPCDRKKSQRRGTERSCEGRGPENGCRVEVIAGSCGVELGLRWMPAADGRIHTRAR